MLGDIDALLVCVLNAGSPGASPLINGFPLGIRLLFFTTLGFVFLFTFAFAFRHEQGFAFAY